MLQIHGPDGLLGQMYNCVRFETKGVKMTNINSSEENGMLGREKENKQSDMEYRLRLLKGKFGGDDNRMFLDLALEEHVKDNKIVGDTVKEFEEQGMMDDFSKMGWLDVLEVARTVLNEEEKKSDKIELLKAVMNNPNSTTAKLIGLAGFDREPKDMIGQLSEGGYITVPKDNDGRAKYEITEEGEKLLSELQGEKE